MGPTHASLEAFSHLSQPSLRNSRRTVCFRYLIRAMSTSSMRPCLLLANIMTACMEVRNFAACVMPHLMGGILYRL